MHRMTDGTRPLLGGRWRLEEPCAEGRAGVPWRGRCDQTGEPVLVRMLDAGPERRAAVLRAVQRLCREARKVHHPAVVPPLDCGTVADGGVWLVRPWMTGAALPETIPWPALTALADTLLGALGELHARDLIHGAISPANVWLGPRGARLTDAGNHRLAEALEDLTEAGRTSRPWVVDLSALGRLLRSRVGDDAPPGALEWTRRLRGRAERPRLVTAADARCALTELPGGTRCAPRLPPDWRGDPPSPPARHPDTPTPLMGREAARDHLWAAAQRVLVEQTPRVVLLSGSPGVGRGRLVSWLSHRLRVQGAFGGMRARHAPVSGPALGLDAMVARFLGCDGLPAPLARARADARLAELGATSTGLRRDLLTWIAPAHPDPVPDPLTRFQRLTELIRLLAPRRALLLRLDDLQWGSDALAFVHHLLDHGRDLAVLVVGTVRPDRLDQRRDEATLITALRARPEVGRLQTDPLTPAETRTLLIDGLGLAPGAADRIAESTGGNPLLAELSVRILDDAGELGHGPAGRTVPADADLPEDLDRAWLRRVGQVLAGTAEGADAALEIAALLGGLVDPIEWTGACDRAGIHVPDGLVDHLEAAGLVRPDPDGPPAGWHLVHGTLIRALVRRARRGGRAAAMHRACAEMLHSRVERAGPSAHPGWTERRVRHLVAAGAFAEAVEPALAEVSRRVTTGSPRTARGLLHIAAPAIAALSDDDPRLGESVLLQAECAALSGDDATLRHRLARLDALSQRAGWTALRARGVALASLARRDADLDLTRLAAAEEVARRRGDASLLAACRTASGRAALRVGDLEEAVLAAEDALSAGEGAGDLRATAAARLLLAHVAIARGEHASADAHVQAAAIACQETRDRHGLAVCDELSGRIARFAGDLDRARSTTVRAAARHAALGTRPDGDPSLELALIDLAVRAWRPARLRVEERLPGLDPHVDPLRRVTAELALAAAAAALHDRTGLTHHLATARRLVRETGTVDPDHVDLGELVARHADAAGLPDMARRARRLASSQQERLVEEGEYLTGDLLGEGTESA